MRTGYLTVGIEHMNDDDKIPVTPTRSTTMQGVPTVSTADCVRFLSDPAAYGEECSGVEVKETHKSWVFLTSGEVYKLKKPIRNHFQNLTTIAARAANTQQEISLNRRLAPDVYLGAERLTLDAQGALALGGEGPVVDWLVRMRRLPEARMLDQIILREGASETNIAHLLTTLAKQLSNFYRHVPRASFAPDAYVTMFEHEQAETRKVLGNSLFALDHGWLGKLLSGFDEALADNRGALEDRVCQGKVVEGHGDLRPEHVCLVDPPVVIDCLEFAQRLRLVDPFDEIVFLGLECDLIGAPWIKERLIGECAEGLNDRPSDNLLLFYEAYRAFLRARQSLAHLLEPEPREPSKWMPKAGGYLRIAEQAVLTLVNREDQPATHRYANGGSLPRTTGRH